MTLRSKPIARLLCILTFPFLAISGAYAQDSSVACRTETVRDIAYDICTVDVTRGNLRLFLNGPSGEPYGRFGPLRRSVESGGKVLAFAMNGGMYHEDRSPVGYYVENGERVKKANTRPGPGNFHMLPNGIFWIEDGRAGVSETRAFLRANDRPDFATQSGPMLVINGKLHPRFKVNSTSRKIRNGVGIVDGGKTAIFAVSRRTVTFHAFASLFRDHLKSNNALYLDGTISSLHAPQIGRSDVLFPMGPIIGVVE